MSKESDGRRYNVKFATIAATSTNNTLVAAVAGKKIRVLSYTILVTAAASAKFQSDTSTDLTGAMPFPDTGGAVNAYNPSGLFETAAGGLLNLNLSASSAYGHLTYQEI